MSQNVPLWYGKPKYHYKLIKNDKLFYSCVSVRKDQEDVRESILRRFLDDSGYFKLYCNGDIIFNTVEYKKALKLKSTDDTIII